MRKSKRIKRPTKNSTKALTGGVVIKETPEKSSSKRKEKYEEVRKKSLRDFHKTHPSGSGTVTKIAPSAAKIKPSVTNEGTGVKPGVPDVTEEESTESEAESWGNDEVDSNDNHDSSGEDNDQENESDDDKTQSDNENESNYVHESDENETSSEFDHQENEEEDENAEEEKEDEYVRTPSYYYPTDDEDKTNVDDNAEGDENEEMDYTTSQLYDDVDIRLNKPITLNQVVEDAHVTLSSVPQKTEVPVVSSSYSSDLASKFLNFSDIPHIDAEIVSPMDVHVNHEVPSKQTPILLTVPVSVITESSPIYSTVIP
ncbi:hypothetical protein Tco_0340942 [Tanacetum coccineum]